MYINKKNFLFIGNGYLWGWIVITLIFSISMLDHTYIYAEKAEISEIFIESEGNNSFEAKIKAHEGGMRRVLLLIVDKIGGKAKDLKEVPYQKLKDTFTVGSVRNELTTPEKYNATVSYSYDKGKIYELLLDYGNAEINDLFYEYIVIPVFKQGSSAYIWEGSKEWLYFWDKERENLERNKLLYPKKTLFLSNKINQDTVFNLTYLDYTAIFANNLFKKIMIISAEFFTDKGTSESIIKIKKYILSPKLQQPKIIETNYPVTSLQDIAAAAHSVIWEVINQYGKLRKQDVDSILLEEELNKAQELREIIMNFEVFDQDELNLVFGKLHKVKEIENFTVSHDDEKNRYKIIIYTNASDYELAEGLYLHGLSYKIYGKLYNLIDIKKGS